LSRAGVIAVGRKLLRKLSGHNAKIIMSTAVFVKQQFDYFSSFLRMSDGPAILLLPVMVLTAVIFLPINPIQ